MTQPGPGAVPGNLPVQTTSFVGRELAVKELAEQVRAHRLVTLTGVGTILKEESRPPVSDLLDSSTLDARELDRAEVELERRYRVPSFVVAAC
jgi:hypothetical protein